jgi:hypothetical protein
MTYFRHAIFASSLLLGSLAACGGEPPPKAPEPPPAEAPKPEAQGPVVQQELGSIDERAVTKKFDDLGAKFEACHTEGRARVEYLAGDVKVFLRVGKDGRVKYGYLEDSTVGDRDTEKCLLDVLSNADWPKPVGGEAEIRNGFGWPAGAERAPSPWESDKVKGALDDAKHIAKVASKCKGGVSGEFKVTAYVEPGEVEATDKPEASTKPAKAGKKKHDKKGQAASKAEHGGRFKAIGVTPPNKEGADKVDCIVEALKPLPLPSPGSYVAKVSFSL